jgi:hypothetical protein
MYVSTDFGAQTIEFDAPQFHLSALVCSVVDVILLFQQTTYNYSIMSSKSRKAAALRAMKEGRGGRLDDYEVQDEEDVYDVYEEEEYQKLVDSRRQREDFVVDDGALLCLCYVLLL